MVRTPSIPAAIGGILGILVLVAIANFLSVRWTSYPFAYCWGRDALRATGLASAYELVGIGLGLLALCLGVAKGVRAMVPVLIVLAVALMLPEWASILLRQGAYCDTYEEVEAQELERQRALAREGRPLPIPAHPSGAPAGLY